MSETPQPASDSQTSFTVLLFSDICDSTALKARHGALTYKAAAELHNGQFERLAAEEKLTLVKNTGDGYFARTTSVAAAVRFALRFQHGMRAMQWPDFPLTTRVGIHAGEVAAITTLGQADVLAPAADLVARVMSLAVGGQILLTRWPFDEARHFVRVHPPVENAAPPALAWLAHGPYLFKGCEDPVEVFEVGAENLAPLAPPPNGEKARRAIRAGDEETLGWRPAAGLEVPGRAGWVLAHKLGEGGFGEVWLAEQVKLKQRRVFKFCFDEDRLRSFKRELTLFRLIRDALGERADIARLYDVKLDAPPFFLESEFAEHGNLVEWCECQGGPGAVPLTVRLEIVAQVAEAVAAAHSVGILHKDLKPQNVLMQAGPDGAPRPQLTDFGIGALADKAALADRAITAAGFTINTLVSSGSGSSMTRLYAPPEQLAGKTYTTQGDLYALGVLLWQFVIGDFTRALAPGWEREVQDDLLRADLAECLDGDPTRRLASATDLADRLRTLETRRAERESERRRVAASARRKRSTRLALVGAGLAVLVAAGLSVSLFRERGLRQQADTAKIEAEQAREQAEELIAFWSNTMRERLETVGRIDLMEDAVLAAEKYFAARGENLTRRERHVKAVVLQSRGMVERAKLNLPAAHAAYESAAGLMQAVYAEEPENFAYIQSRAATLQKLAGSTWDGGRIEEAVPLIETAFAVIKPVAQKPDAPRTLRRLAVNVEEYLSHALRAVKRDAEAEIHAETAWLLSKKLYEQEPAAIEFAAGYVSALLSHMYRSKGEHWQPAEVEPRFEEARRLIEMLRDKEPQNRLHLRLAFTLEQCFGHFAEWTGKYQDAISAYDRAIKLAEDYRKWDPLSDSASREFCEAHRGSFYVLKNQRRFAEATVHIQANEKICLERLSKLPNNQFWLSELGDAYFRLAEMAGSKGDLKHAEEHYLKVVEINARLKGAKTDRSGADSFTTYGRLAGIVLGQKRVDEAVEYGRKAVEGYDRYVSLKDRMHGHNRIAYASALRVKGDFQAAERTTAEAVDIFRKIAGTEWVYKRHQDLAHGLGAHVDSLLALNRIDEARVACDEMIYIHDRIAIADPENESWQWHQQDAYGKRAKCEELASEGTPEEKIGHALTVMDKAVATFPKNFHLHKVRGEMQGRLAKVLLEQGETEKARLLAREHAEASAVWAMNPPKSDRLRSAGMVWRTYGKMLGHSATGKWQPEEQKNAFTKAVELCGGSVRLARERPEETSDSDLRWALSEHGWAWLDLGNTLGRLHQSDEAVAAFENALKLAEEFRRLTAADSTFGPASQLCNIRYNYTERLIEAGRTDAARRQMALLENEIRTAEKIPNAKPEDINRIRGWLEHVQRRLPASQAPAGVN